MSANLRAITPLFGLSALVAAYEQLAAPVSAHARFRCSACGAQYERSRLGVSLCARNVAGVEREFSCALCSSSRSRQ